jgi:putative acetyltransferase
MAERANSDVRIVPVEGPAALDMVRTLFEEYWQSFGFTPCFQNFGEELAGLPGAYAPPSGRLALAFIDGQAAGCVALRCVDARRAEPKRLYVRPAFRGYGLGRVLLEWVMNEARAAGYAELVGDTMPVMKDALALYDRMGFERTGVGTPVQASACAQIAEEPILIRIKL